MITLLRSRRSIRKFTGQKISKDIQDLLIEAMLRSQSSRNIRPWEFIIVDDKKKLEHLSKAKQHGSGLIKGAALAVVVIADTNKSDVWVEDASIASIQLQLMADSLGLGSCWVQIRNRMATDELSSDQFVKQALEVPDNYSVESVISIGYPAESPKPHSKENLQYDKVKYGSFSKPFYQD
ncbi:MAG: hypothetical protein D6B28_05225 [Gammaproteobacteria bacterium]|nr:MAG: hypothetical protein D6B28_05225 [Gammaproteobacteria bacterium]